MSYKSRGNYHITTSICKECGKLIRDKYVRLCSNCLKQDEQVKRLKRGSHR